ncbi:MAG: prolipoprotein diacylglyceryl transferase [Nanoarchaeota archaeon]
MFTSSIDPILAQIGPFQIRYYGIVYALAFLFAMYKCKQWGRQGILKISDEQAYDLAFWLAVGSVLGGRVFNIIIWEPGYYFENPLKILYFWEGGMAYHGGIIGAIIAVWLYCRKHSLPALRIGDLLAPYASFVLGIGRLANFTNAEIYGPITKLSWCVNFPGVQGCRHPYQIYSALKRFLIGGVLLRISKQKKPDGYVLWIGIFLMNAGRFFLDFLRDDAEYLIVWLSLGQWVSLVFALGSAYLLWGILTKNKITTLT